MLSITKIFHFEMAHAIYGYSGACRHIHGHSYELHVTMCTPENDKDFIPAPGFILDFKELKQLIMSAVIETFDHKLVLSREYLIKNPNLNSQENLIIWEAEPTAENMLVYIQRILRAKLPPAINLKELKLYETNNSYAEWTEN